MNTLLYSSDQNLLDFWKKRLKAEENEYNDYAQGYKDALRECIIDLASQFPQEINPLDIMGEHELNDYAMSLEADTWGSQDY